MKELLEIAVELAQSAGAITLEHFGAEIAVETKADSSPVTIADRQAEEFVRAELEKRFPNDGILGEEFGEKIGTSGRRWILDPIDGTKNFIRGVPMYGTMLALEEAGRPIVGVVHYPPSAETMSAAVGHGCFYNGAPCRVSKTTDLKQASAIITGLETHVRFLGEESLLRLIRATDIQRTWGDCYGYMLVATGRCDIMIDPIVKWWDVAAVVPIIQEAGGIITDVDGACGPKMWNAVSANPALQAAVVKLLTAK